MRPNLWSHIKKYFSFLSATIHFQGLSGDAGSEDYLPQVCGILAKLVCAGIVEVTRPTINS